MISEGPGHHLLPAHPAAARAHVINVVRVHLRLVRLGHSSIQYSSHPAAVLLVQYTTHSMHPVDAHVHVIDVIRVHLRLMRLLHSSSQ